MKKNNLIYLLAGGVAVFLVVRAMRKKDDDGEANFMNIDGESIKTNRQKRKEKKQFIKDYEAVKSLR